MSARNSAGLKSEKQFYYEVESNWQLNKNGIVHSRDVVGAIHTSTPKQFGGEGNDWSPEHLFLGSICSCYMSTYISFSKKMNFNITRLDCSAIGQTERVDDSYKFTYINLYPEITIADMSILRQANLAVEKTQKYCLVGNSINAVIIYHTEVLIEPRRDSSAAFTGFINSP
jgi:organic hydroperoxide reductase OsmC/OhrA